MASKAGRGAQGAGSIRQRPDGLWEGRFVVGRDPGTGKPVRRSIYGPTQKEVREKMTAILHDIDTGTYSKPNKITVGQWLDEWLKTFCANSVKQSTYISYEAAIKNHIKPVLGAVELQAVKGFHVQRVYNSLTERGLSAKTVKNTAAVIHKAFSVAQKQGILQANPADAAELPKVVQHEVKPLSDEEVPVFLQAIDSSPMRNAFALCLFAGLREGECLGLSWSQVDFKRGRITVSQQLQKARKKGEKYYILPTTKSSRPRTIEPPPLAFEYLKAEQHKQLENRLKAGKAWSNPDNLVFTDELGSHYAIPTFYGRFKRIAASIGRPDARPHDLRHTAATVAIASGADLKSVQSLLGHSTASFTLSVYAHTSEQMMKDTAQRVQSYYDGLTKSKA